MRPLALAATLLALLMVPAGAAGKEPKAPVRVLWNSTPTDLRAGDTWDARLSVLQGPGGYDPGKARPTILVTDLDSGAKRRVAMTVDVPPSTFKASVPFPSAGSYSVAVRSYSIPVAVGQAGDGRTWPWLLTAGLALVLLGGAWLKGRAPRRRVAASSR
jgi:hypothetical protein